MVLLGMDDDIWMDPTLTFVVPVEFQNKISIKVHACLTILGEEWEEWAERASQSLSHHFDRGPAGLELTRASIWICCPFPTGRHGNFGAGHPIWLLEVDILCVWTCLDSGAEEPSAA